MIAYDLKQYQPKTLENPIVVIPSSAKYAKQMVELMCAAYGCEPNETYSAAQFRKHAQIFPEGQFIAVDTNTDRVVGLTASMRVAFDPAQPLLHSWVETTNYGWLTTHNPDGEWMYGVESAVHPDYQGKGVGSKLMDARFDTLRRLNLRGLVAGGMIMDYHKVAHEISAEDYVREVVEGKRFDNNLTKQLKKGFRVHNLIPDYVYDPRALNWGVAIVWDNPDYIPGQRVTMPIRPSTYTVALKPRQPELTLVKERA